MPERSRFQQESFAAWHLHSTIFVYRDYDIFERFPDGKVFWRETVVGREELLLRERKKSETLYRTTVWRQPELIDEDLGYSHKARTEDQLAWAEQRLQDLGFTVSTENNIKSYVREHEGLVVYADPRRDGEISFRIFKKPPPNTRKPLDQFVLPDRRKHGLLAKYENKIASIAMPRGR